MAGPLQLLRAVFGNRVQMVEELGAQIPRIGRSQFGRVGVILVNSPELVPEVLIDRVDDYQKGPVLRVITRPLLGDGLLTSEGQQHRERRRLVAPAFAHQRVSKYAAVMNECTERSQGAWGDGQSMDMAQEMMRLTLDIVGRTLFDVELIGKADSLGRDITQAQRAAVLQMRLPFKLPFQWKSEAALRRLNETVYAMIRERRASGEDKGDLLSMLLLSKDEDTGQHLTDQQTRDEAMTLFLAGHETTAQAMAWSWYLLARNPQYFKRLREEGAPFALQVMKESMRLYPPAFILARSALRDTTIDGFPVKKEELVFIAPWLFHRDPRLFEDPLQFDPDRFLPEREAKLPRFAYMPFGGGRRICIGNQFALMEGQIILNTIAQHVEMELLSQEPIEVEPFITLRPKGGVGVKVRRLN
ncbi:MAG TPA: cytochrome P450 [Bryobacteraceae bacterium]|jgi:cytochrome P450|nr:cytochrome P450 [Bryobacteraceae bacterium]